MTMITLLRNHRTENKKRKKYAQTNNVHTNKNLLFSHFIASSKLKFKRFSPKNLNIKYLSSYMVTAKRIFFIYNA